MLSIYYGPMIARLSGPHQGLLRAFAIVATLAPGLSLSGCADTGDSMTTAFADPAKYALYDCKQLEAERKRLADRTAELKGLMEKAQTGVGGSVVAEVAYRNDYITVRGQARNAEEAWQRNKCRETQPTAGPPLNDKTGRPVARSGNAVY
jgi:hypothetical protein